MENSALRVVLPEGIDPSAVDGFRQAGLTQVVSKAHAPKGSNPADAPDFPEGREDPEQSAELERQQDA